MRVQSIVVRPGAGIEELVKALIDSAADRIVFVSGPEPSVLNQEINLRLLKFYAEEEDKEFGIQTANPQLKVLADGLEIPLFREISGAARSNAAAAGPLPETVDETAAAPDDQEAAGPALRTRSSLRHQGGMFIATAAACFALVIAAWWLLQPNVVVTVYPKEKDLNIRTQALTDTAFTDRQLIQGKIPAKIVVKEASLTVHTMTTGRKTVGVTAAAGKVTFINNSPRVIVVPKGSVLIGRENCRFVTTGDVLVPQKTSKTILGIPVGEEYGRSEAGIVALQKGVAGNQPAKAIQKIEGPLQRSLKAINLAPTARGADKEVPVVTAEDLKRSEAEARRQMDLAAPDELAVLTGSDQLFWPDLVRTTITRNLFQPEIGMESAALTNRLDYRAAALVVSRVELQKYLAHLLTVKMPANFRAVGRSLQLTTIRATKRGDGGALLYIEAQARIRGVLDSRKLQGLIAGQTLADAKAALTAQDELADFQINLRHPLSRLPRFAFQIKIVNAQESGDR